VHGFGGGYLPPVVPAPGWLLPAPGFMLAAGMTMVVQPNDVTRDGHAWSGSGRPGDMAKAWTRTQIDVHRQVRPPGSYR
jgi:hypothetical protein